MDPTQVDQLTLLHSEGGLSAGNRLTLTHKLARKKRSSLFFIDESNEEKSFETMTTGPNAIKLFTDVIYEFSQ